MPPGASEAERSLADDAQQRIIDVMMERGDFRRAASVLKAATHLREEICGSLTQRHEHSGPGGVPLHVEVRSYADPELEAGEPDELEDDPADPAQRHATGSEQLALPDPAPDLVDVDAGTEGDG